MLSLTRGRHCTATGLGDKAFYTIYAHSPLQRDTAAALAEFALSECSCISFVCYACLSCPLANKRVHWWERTIDTGVCSMVGPQFWGAQNLREVGKLCQNSGYVDFKLFKDVTPVTTFVSYTVISGWLLSEKYQKHLWAVNTLKRCACRSEGEVWPQHRPRCHASFNSA